MRLPRRGRKVSPGECPVPRGWAPGMPGVPQLFPCQEGPVTIRGAEARDRPICPHLWATKAGPRAHPKLAAAPSAPLAATGRMPAGVAKASAGRTACSGPLQGCSATRELPGVRGHEAPSPFPAFMVVGGLACLEEGGPWSYPQED